MGNGEPDSGGESQERKAQEHVKRAGYAEGGEVHSDEAQDKKLIKKAFRQHEKAEHGGKHSELKLKKGGLAEATGTRPTGGRIARKSGGKVGSMGLESFPRVLVGMTVSLPDDE